MNVCQRRRIHELLSHNVNLHYHEAGITKEEMFHVAILAITPIGWPAAHAAMTWIDGIANN